MALASLSDLIGGFTSPRTMFKFSASSGESGNVMNSLFYNIGCPSAAVAPASGMAGAVVTPSYGGVMPFVNPTGGKKSYLARATIHAAITPGAFYLCDRLWHNSGIVNATLTAQTVNSVAFPARDNNGSTDGEGVLIALEVSTATSNGTAITGITVSYTNSAGTAGRTATINGTPVAYPATAAISTFLPFRLQAGDVGVRSIQSITLGTSLGTGTVHLVAYRNLLFEAMNSTYTSRSLNFRDTGLVRLYDDTSIFAVVHPNSSAAVAFAFAHYSIVEA